MALISEVNRRMLLASAGATVAGSGAIRRRAAASNRDGRRDFAFLIGRWDVVHQRRLQHLAGGPRWERFKSRCIVTPILGGLGNIDDHVLDLPSDERHMATLRLYDPVQDLWSIRSMDSRSPGIAGPAQGRFLDGVGVFHGAGAVGGEPERVRLIWSGVTRQAATFTRAVSTDDRRRWEMDWTMQFLRRS